MTTLNNEYRIKGLYNEFTLDISASGHWIVESIYNGERFSIGHSDEWTLGEAIHEAFYMANNWRYDVEYEEDEYEETPDDNWWVNGQMEEMIISGYGWD